MVFGVAALLILWQLLLPGYVLTLDMIFTPFVYFRPDYGDLYYAFPLYAVLWFFHWIVPVWLLQKILLLGLLFFAGYFAYRFLPLPENRLIRLISGLIYIFNPFVYTRFLAGHWTVLGGYALMPLLVYLLLGFLDEPVLKKSIRYFLVLWLMAVWSVQMFAMAVFLSLGTVVVLLVKNIFRKNNKWLAPFFRNGLIGSVLFLIAGSYWLAGFFLRSAPVEGRFTLSHWEVFSASTRSGVPLWLNLFSGNGFWAENQVWARMFVWPQDLVWFWGAWAGLILLILAGIFFAFFKRSRYAFFFFIIGLLGYIFSSGVSDTIFRGMNLWFFEHLPFWSGFRDSQKFSAFLWLAYVFFAGHGLASLVTLIQKTGIPKLLQKSLGAAIFLIPLGLGFLLLFGLQGQIRPVWYPESWHTVHQILDADPAQNKMLVLPWHRYMPFAFANNFLLDNPTNRFFGSRAIAPKNLEIGEVYDQEIDPDYRAIDAFIATRKNGENVSLQPLTERGVRYILFLKDLGKQDRFSYPFLDSAVVKTILDTGELRLYKIE